MGLEFEIEAVDVTPTWEIGGELLAEDSLEFSGPVLVSANLEVESIEVTT